MRVMRWASRKHAELAIGQLTFTQYKQVGCIGYKPVDWDEA